MSGDHRALLEIACAAALAAGAAIMEIYAEGFTVRRKADASPVTLADDRAERVILQALAAANGLPHAAPVRFWLVDPLDGTKEFISRNGEFTVNIALVEGGRAVLGVVHAPALGVTYAALNPGSATRRRGGEAPQPIAARPIPARGPVVIHSRSHADERRLAEYVAALPEAERRRAGSAIKFCLIAAGEADLYPRFGPTMEWDTAAGQAVLEAAGGAVTTLDGAPLRYGKSGFLNPEFIACGRSSPAGTGSQAG
jgi:3'(2'), 5'-bisphosphate nucleotidase